MLNHRAIYLGQRSFRLKVTVQCPDTQTGTHIRPITLPDH